MRKIAALVTAVLLIICMLVGCGETENKVEADTQGTLPVESSEEFAEATEASEVDDYEVPEITEEAAISDQTEPSNIEEQTTNAQTTNSTMVWIPQTGSKYHSSQFCSGMENPSQVTQEQAEKLGYTACKKCH